MKALRSVSEDRHALYYCVYVKPERRLNSCARSQGMWGWTGPLTTRVKEFLYAVWGGSYT